MPEGAAPSHPGRAGAPQRAEGGTRRDTRCPRSSTAKREKRDASVGEARLLIRLIHSQYPPREILACKPASQGPKPLRSKGAVNYDLMTDASWGSRVFEGD